MPDQYELEVEAIGMMYLTCRSDAIGIVVVRSRLQWKAIYYDDDLLFQGK